MSSRSAEIEEVRSGHESRFRSKLIFMGITGALLVLLALFSLGIGAVGFSLGETLKALIGEGSAMARTIIWNIRAPRVLTAIVVGAGLAVAGAALQSC